MSRLDDLVRRMQTQRAVLNRAIGLLNESQIQGLVVELGLGSGRTFDHLRENFPDKQILTFDWEMEATKDCQPTKEQFIKGEIQKTFPKFSVGKEHTCCFLHIDIGTRDRKRDQELYSSLTDPIVSMLCENGLLVSDRMIHSIKLEEISTVDCHVEGWPYYLYRKKN